jgi:hypothetical protein
MKHLVFNWSFLLFVALMSQNIFGQQSISSIGTPVIENFTGYLGTSTLPSNWTTSGSGGNGNSFQGTNQATNTAGGWYGNNNMSYLGSGSASNGNATWRLQNNTGSTITSFDISFVARLWRTGTNSPSVTLSYSTNSTGTVPPAGQLTNILTYNDATPSISSGTTLSQTNISVTVPNGDYLYIRFIHAGGSNSDNLGWDDVSITCSAIPLCSAPATQASNITFSNVSDVSMDLNWTNGSGDGRVIIMNTTNTFTAPTNGTNPSANTVYGGSGQQVIFNGTGSGPISITGLSPNTTYWFRAYEFCNPDRVYQTASATNNPSSQSTLACLSSTHYFRSVASGNWNSLTTWESSSNQISWGTPSCVPDFNANIISIENSHIVTISGDVEVDQVVIQVGGTLRHASGVLTLRNGPGHDLSILNTGILEYAGGSHPQYENLDVRINVASGGIIRVNSVPSGLSENLAGNLSSNRFIYNTNSVFNWNTSSAFSTGNQVYFPDANSTTIPIFRVTANVGSIGAGTPTVINGIYESNANSTFVNSGTKTFRNGIIGSGNVTQGTNCGAFIVNGEIAYLGGTGVLNLNTNPLLITGNALLIMTSNKTINTTGVSPIGQIQIDNGSTIDLATYILSGSGSVALFNSAIIRTAHPNGLDGALNSLAAVNFVAPYNQTLDFYAGTFQNSGFVSPGACANLILGAGTWLQVVENLTASNTITMNAGSRITVAGGETLYLSNPAVGALVGGNLVGATNYIHGRLQRATTSGNTYQFPLGFPPYNAQGFTITVTGAGDILGNMETNSSAPLYNYVYCDLETPTVPGQQIGQGLPAQDGILDQMILDLQSPTQWEITNPGGGITSYDLVLSANGSNDILPISSAGGTPIRFVMKNGEPGNTGVATTSTAEFPQIGFDACPNGYSLSGMTGFSTFTINGSSAPNTALPVEFLFFAASVNNQNQVVLNWATASELNNDYFTVERSVDGFSWEIVTIVQGNGTTPVRNDYSAIDTRPYSGLSYYRLKQTDFDGAFDYANIVSVFIDGVEKSLIKVVNLMGQEVDINSRGMVILIFSDGSALKVVNE